MRLLDLFSGAGGAAMGYYRAGFTDIVGVDIKPQPRYPFTFIQSDALEYLAAHGHEFDAIHVSPPCQAYSTMSVCNPGRTYPDLIGDTRELLKLNGSPYVIENVNGAPLLHSIRLCGLMFGLKVYRHRYFESNIGMLSPGHPAHRESIPRAGRGASSTGFISVAGHLSDVKAARIAMGIDWMGGNELSLAIPPAYTEFIGKQLLAAIQQ